MRNLINLIIRFSALILFIVLEIISFYLIVNYNKSQKEIWGHSSGLVSGYVNNKMEGVENFFEMQQENDSLLVENAKLLETIINYRVSVKDNSFDQFDQKDTTMLYSVIPSRVCSKTVNLRNNYITLCKGKRDSIRVGMGVIANNGIVGIVKSVSQNYATVLMVLNSQSRTSVKINSKEFHGNLIWESGDPNIHTLIDIPKHANVEIGDSISTNGYSICYPPDIYIGKVVAFDPGDGSNSFKIDIKMENDLSKLEYAYVVDFKEFEEKEELIELEDE